MLEHSCLGCLSYLTLDVECHIEFNISFLKNEREGIGS